MSTLQTLEAPATAETQKEPIPLEHIAIDGVTANQNLALHVLLARESVHLPTDHLHAQDKGKVRECSSVSQINAILIDLETIPDKKERQRRIEIFQHHLFRLVASLLPEELQ